MRFPWRQNFKTFLKKGTKKMFRALTLNQFCRTFVNRGSRNASSLIVCGHKDGKFDSSIVNTITAATELGGEVIEIIIFYFI